jgi:rhodanese-related sulfurtransferase
MSRTTVDDLLRAARERLDRLEPTEAHELACRGDAVLVDIRAGDLRVADGAIPGAVHAPRTVLEWRADPASGHSDPRMDDLGARLVLVCNEGYASSLAAATLQDLGFARATDVIGGFAAWRAAGLPVEPA